MNLINLPLIQKYIPKNIDDFNLTQETKDLLNILIKDDNILFLINGGISSGKSKLINVILNKYYNTENNKNLLENENILYISLLKDQGINYYKNDLINFCNIYSYKKKTIVIEDIELFNEQIQIIFYNLINKYNKTVNFIISCNDILKINNNIIDILELIKIESIDKDFLLNILDNIIENENINIKDYKLKELLIKMSNNYIPNLINIVERIKISNNNSESAYNSESRSSSEYELSDEIIQELENNIITRDFEKYIELCKKKYVKNACEYLINLYNNGYSVIDILDDFLSYLKHYDKLLSENEKFSTIKILIKYINIFYSLHEDKIELFFLTNNIIKILR
ncbi:MAG: hypothetical protein CMP83_08055 [Gammaproteobacteria bacterium]|nr:hypothetical protein [Gammaproteobacteria bacterium]